MANQDLLFSILPRPPLAPGSGDFHRDIPAIQKEPVTPKTEIHKDPAEHSPQDENHPRHHKPPAEDDVDVDADNPENPTSDAPPGTGNEHVDLFV